MKEENKAELKQAYFTLQKASGIEKGDTVRVLRTAESEEMGWTDSWMDDMDTFVGQQLTVERVGYAVILSSAGRTRSFPFFVLELVKKKPSLPANTKLWGGEARGGYEVEYFKDGHSKVGCQELSFDLLKEIYTNVLASKNTSPEK